MRRRRVQHILKVFCVYLFPFNLHVTMPHLFQLKTAQNRSPKIFAAFQDFLLKMPDWFYPLDQEKQVDKSSGFKWRASTVFPRLKQPLGGLGYGRHLQTPTSLAQHLALLGRHCILVAQGRHKDFACYSNLSPHLKRLGIPRKRTFFVTALPTFHSRGLTMAFAWSSVIFLSLTMPVCVLGLDSEVFQNPYRCWRRHWKTSARKPRANILPIKMAFNRLGTERMSEVSCYRFWWSVMMRKWMGFVMVKQKTATFPVQ